MKPFYKLGEKTKKDIVMIIKIADMLDIKEMTWTIHSDGEEIIFSIEKMGNWLLKIISVDVNTFINYEDVYNLFTDINFCYDHTYTL